MPGRDFFLVRPFVKQLNEWIKCRKSGKPWVVRQSMQSTKVPPKKESRRTSSVPTQRPEKHGELDSAPQLSEAHLELGRSGSFSVEDMFRVNEERYGVKSTYQFELYTTQLKSAKSGASSSVPADAAPGGGYRQCTVKDMHVSSTGRSVSEPSFEDIGSPPAAKLSGTGKVSGNGPSPPRGNQRTADSKRRKGEPLAPTENESRTKDVKQPPSSSLEAAIGADLSRAGPVPGNVEFGKGFRFNTMEVMAPILAMS